MPAAGGCNGKIAEGIAVCRKNREPEQKRKLAQEYGNETLGIRGFGSLDRMEEYTVGNDRELDMRLAKYDVEGSLAHTFMPEKNRAADGGGTRKTHGGTPKEIAAEIEAGRFEIEPGTEDVHSQVELMLTRRLGDAGKKSTRAARATTRCWSTSNCSCATNCARPPKP